MKKFHLFGYSIVSILIAATSWAAHAFDYAASAVTSFLEIAFPATPPPEVAIAMATAPRVTGLHQTRAFHGRLAERSDGRHRAPLSSAFAAAA